MRHVARGAEATQRYSVAPRAWRSMECLPEVQGRGPLGRMNMSPQIWVVFRLSGSETS